MSLTYHAILRGNTLEWLDGGPSPNALEQPIEVEIRISSSMRVELKVDEANACSKPGSNTSSSLLSDPVERGRRMADALRRLAVLRPFEAIEDSVAWQQEIREDRPLPGREP